MKERPILFSSEMVRAILGDRKSQTRRVIKPQPSQASRVVRIALMPPRPDGTFEELWWDRVGSLDGKVPRCPYGRTGDRLWVRESFQPFYGPEAGLTKPNWKTGYGYQVSYPATDGVYEYHDEERGLTSRCTPSIHMPRWASRMTLEIADIRIERLQEITPADCEAEGISREPYKNLMVNAMRADYHQLWDKINAERGFGWKKNPWVWVIEFKRGEVRQ